MDEERPLIDEDSATSLDRRELFKRGLAASAAVAVFGPTEALAGRQIPQAADKLFAKPKHGGHLTIATVTGGTSDTFNPALANAPSDAMRLYTHFDPLIRMDPHFSYAPGLALKWTPNKDYTAWEITLRPGVHWHDGKKFTADDVIYTLRLMGSPAHLGHSSVQNVRLKDLKKLSPTLLRVPLLHPDARLMDQFVYFNSSIVVQNGRKDFNRPVGTGPFKIKSWTPGVQSVSVANRDYWDHPKPWVDGLTILGISDNNARLNAVLGGQANICSPLAFPLAAANRNNPNIHLLVAQSGPAQVFYMDVTKAPFNDPRVRQAFKLVVDRQAMINTALNGYGIPANDIVGLKGMIDYDSSLPRRQQDLDQAKSLLAKAGQSGLKVTLHTAPVSAGVTAAAQVFAQQAKGAGIDVNVQNEDPGAYFNPSLLWGKMTFAQDTWPLPAVDYFWNSALDAGSLFDETHWSSPKTSAVLKAANAASGARRKKLWNQIQAEQYQQGGYIVWAHRRSVDAYATNLRGMKPGWAYSGNDQRHWDTWIA